MLFDQSFSHHIPRWNNLDVFFNFSNKNSFEEMDSVVNILTINWSFNPNLGATNSLISSGYIELLKNDEIKIVENRTIPTRNSNELYIKTFHINRLRQALYNMTCMLSNGLPVDLSLVMTT